MAAARQFPDVVLVAQSMGAFTAAMAAEQLPVQELILVNAMIPLRDEMPGRWWDATGAIEARERAARERGYGDFDVATYFLHDVDTTGLEDGGRPESDAAFGSPCTFTSWPEHLRVLAGADDRFFPADFQARSPRNGWAPTSKSCSSRRGDRDRLAVRAAPGDRGDGGARLLSRDCAGRDVGP